MRSFLPPCGDKLKSCPTTILESIRSFPSPCGDKLKFLNVFQASPKKMFPSPCGENPLSHGLRRASSPERGSLVQGKWQLEKRSLRESWRAAPERVFTGISWNATMIFRMWSLVLGFRPLAGISWNLSILMDSWLLSSFRPLGGISWNHYV